MAKYNNINKKKEFLCTKVAMMQPSFLSWQGFFELILKSDKFIFLDDFQLSIQSHHTRNKLFVSKNKTDYYLIPIQKSKCFKSNLNKVSIIEDSQWKKKLLRKLEYNYAKAPYFKQIHPIIEKILNTNYTNLATINMAIIKEFCTVMGIKKEFLYSSDFTNATNSQSQRSKRVEELLDWANSDIYLSAFGSYNYMIEDNFNFDKYNTIFQNYNPKPYKQIHSEEFVPYLSILDALYNIGGEGTLELIKKGTDKWLTHEERDSYES